MGGILYNDIFHAHIAHAFEVEIPAVIAVAGRLVIAACGGKLEEAAANIGELGCGGIHLRLGKLCTLYGVETYSYGLQGFHGAVGNDAVYVFACGGHCEVRTRDFGIIFTVCGNSGYFAVCHKGDACDGRGVFKCYDNGIFAFRKGGADAVDIIGERGTVLAVQGRTLIGGNVCVRGEILRAVFIAVIGFGYGSITAVNGNFVAEEKVLCIGENTDIARFYGMVTGYEIAF